MGSGGRGGRRRGVRLAPFNASDGELQDEESEARIAAPSSRARARGERRIPRTRRRAGKNGVSPPCRCADAASRMGSPVPPGFDGASSRGAPEVLLRMTVAGDDTLRPRSCRDVVAAQTNDPEGPPVQAHAGGPHVALEARADDQRAPHGDAHAVRSCRWRRCARVEMRGGQYETTTGLVAAEARIADGSSSAPRGTRRRSRCGRTRALDVESP